jgi:peptidoglycan/xylan/chitin deacetylase (PgdA/CDA1 family)
VIDISAQEKSPEFSGLGEIILNFGEFMAARRTKFIRTTSGLAKLMPVPFLMRLCGQRFLVVLYHAVSDDSPAHIRHLYQVKTQSEFAKDLDYLLKHLQPIDVFVLRDHVSGKSPLKKPGFLITFDDGLREFGEVAAPILKQKGVPAINFLNSDFVGNQGLFFRYKASLLIEHLLGKEGDEAVKSWMLEHDLGEKTLKTALLSLKYQQKGQLDALARGVGLDFDQYLQQERPYLDPQEIKSLQNDGFHFGAHSIDHPEYQYLDIKEQLRQTRASQAAVSDQFGVEEGWFAFPFTDFGVSSSFFNLLYADSPAPELTFGCAGLKNDVLPRHIQRIPLESTGNLSARDILPAELLYYLMKSPLGRNKIHRS